MPTRLIPRRRYFFDSHRNEPVPFELAVGVSPSGLPSHLGSAHTPPASHTLTPEEMTMQKHAFWLLALLAGCSSSTDRDSPGPTGGPVESADSFGQSTPVPDGYTRYYSTVQEVSPGESLMLVEWVTGAFDEDMDVMDVKGGQTKGGHHASLTASTQIEPVGTVRPQVINDQFSATFLGAIGGEGQGAGAFSKPDNYAFRLSKGAGLYLQTHYINATDSTLRVRSYVDIELTKQIGRASCRERV